MKTNTLNRVIRRLRQTAFRHEDASVADGELLDYFVSRRDAGAFEALVRRHGPMVLGVCRRILRNEADAEDAFQATFLVLVRKAASIRPRGMVSNWLFGVARNTALKARTMIHKRRTKEKETGLVSSSQASAEVWQQVQALLDEELSQLPEKYRLPVVLCELEGKTTKEAARHLGWPQGTVATRLAQGRKILAMKLSDHGLTLSAGALAVLLHHGAASASAPASLISSTTKAASLFAAGQVATPGLVSGTVAALTEGVLKAMLYTKLRAAVALVLIFGFVATGAIMLTWRAAAGQDAKKPTAKKRAESAENQQTTPAQPVDRQGKGQLPAQAGQQFFEPELGETVTAVKYDSMGKWMATAELGGNVRLWNTQKQRPGPVLRGPTRTVRSITFTPDGDRLIGGSDDGKIYIWDVRTGKLRSTLEGHDGWVCSVALAGDGKTLASSARSFAPGGAAHRELKVWDLSRQKVVRDIQCNDDISSGGACGLVFAPGTDLLAAACCGEFRGITVWNTTNGKEVKRFTYDGGLPLALAISPDGKWLVSGGVGLLNVWDWKSGKLQQTLKYDGYFRGVAFSRDGSRLVAGSTGPEVTRAKGTHLSSVVHCWEAKAWTRLWTVQGLYGEVWSLDISPDGRTVASSDASGTAIIDAVLGRVQGFRMSTPRYMDTEEYGAARVVKRPDWPDALVEAVNVDGRLYSRWVNGTESLFYRGRARALNEAIQKYIGTKDDMRQLVLLPGSGKTRALGGKPVVFDWQFRVPGGLDKAQSAKKRAVMTVYISVLKPRPVEQKQVQKWLKDLESDAFANRAAAEKQLRKLGNDAKPLLRAALQGQPSLETRRRLESLLNGLPSFDLTDLEIPKGITIISAGDLITRGLQELKDSDRNVRSLAIQDLCDLARFSDEIVPALVRIFENDKDVYIREIAATCLAYDGIQAKLAMPALKRGLGDPDPNIRRACEHTLKRLVSREDTSGQQERIRRELAILKEIDEFKKTRSGND